MVDKIKKKEEEIVDPTGLEQVTMALQKMEAMYTQMQGMIANKALGGDSGIRTEPEKPAPVSNKQYAEQAMSGELNRQPPKEE